MDSDPTSNQEGRPGNGAVIFMEYRFALIAAVSVAIALPTFAQQPARPHANALLPAIKAQAIGQAALLPESRFASGCAVNVAPLDGFSGPVTVLIQGDVVPLCVTAPAGFSAAPDFYNPQPPNWQENSEWTTK